MLPVIEDLLSHVSEDKFDQQGLSTRKAQDPSACGLGLPKSDTAAAVPQRPPNEMGLECRLSECKSCFLAGLTAARHTFEQHGAYKHCSMF